MNATLVAFWIFAATAIGSALVCVTRRSPVASALWLVVTMFSLAGIFLLLDAQFIAALQVMVYAGAIMVLFLFVIMLLNLGRDRRSDMLGWPGRVFMLGLGTVLAAELWVLWRVLPPEELTLPAGSLAAAVEAEGAVQIVSEPLFRTFLIPFEITSVLLLAAVVGAVVLAKRKL